jgi:hypothetical protein
MYLPDAMRDRLAAEKRRSGAPLAEIVRRAVDRYLTDREEEANTKPAREQKARTW